MSLREALRRIMLAQPIEEADMRDDDAVLACEEAMEPSVRQAVDDAIDAGWDRETVYAALFSLAENLRRADMEISQRDEGGAAPPESL